jgi:hypothetical protein
LLPSSGSFAFILRHFDAIQSSNFPQAFTHLALISAAFNLDPMLGS